jgi:hypothetical protein
MDKWEAMSGAEVGPMQTYTIQIDEMHEAVMRRMEVVMNYPLLLMACSTVKKATPHALPFVDVYAGPMWQQIFDYPRDKIACVSAEHGLLEPKESIVKYDRLMDEDRLEAIINDGKTIKRLIALIEEHSEVIVVGSCVYKLIGLAVAMFRPDLLTQIRFCCGSYLQQRKALNLSCRNIVCHHESRLIPAGLDARADHRKPRARS